MAELPSQSSSQPDMTSTAERLTSVTEPVKDHSSKVLRARALASWEPAYPSEAIDYYEEYIHRCAPLAIGWLKLPKLPNRDRSLTREATGVGMLGGRSAFDSSHVISPLDDGSICIWDISARSTFSLGGKGEIIARSKPGLLSGHAPQNDGVMTDTGAVECVSIENSSRVGYFAVQNLLHEVDLVTLGIRSTKNYPFPITALSEASSDGSVAIGTNMTIHLNDARDRAFAGSTTNHNVELISGSARTYATLPQPGPLSILNHAEGAQDQSSMWVAGRFTSLLEYDRRFFPRLRRTIFSGARIASLAQIAHPFLGRDLDLMRNPSTTAAMLQEARSQPGRTILAAAEYKGKGSLELYGLPDARFYHNRQTASSSKLLSVAAHGGRVVFSDGNGNVKWVERDGYSHVRTFNINSDIVQGATSEVVAGDSQPAGIWSGSGSELPGQGDIIQKLMATNASAAVYLDRGRRDINRRDLLLWTGDGRLGLLGFGREDPLGDNAWHDAIEVQARSIEERAKEDAERQYGLAMRRALERNADEVRFVRGLGMM
jgi:hypothetical protein